MVNEAVKTGVQLDIRFAVIYGLSFIIMFFALFRALRHTESEIYKNVFWILAGFAVCKGMSAWSDAVSLMTGSDLELYAQISFNLSETLAVISNLFILQFAIGLITYKLPSRKIFQLFPVILFSGFIILFLSGVIDKVDADQMGRYNFGYNGGILTSVSLVNLYYNQRQSISNRLSRGILGLAAGFIFYSVFDGIVARPIFGVPVSAFRIFSAVVLAAASFQIRELFVQKKTRKVGFI